MTTTTAHAPNEAAPKREAAPSPATTDATSELLRASVEAKNTAVQLISAVQSVVGLAQGAVREQLEARPYITLGAAAGAGYVLGGGLASSLTRTMLRAGGKVATGYLLQQLVTRVAASEPDGDAAPAAPPLSDAE